MPYGLTDAEWGELSALAPMGTALAACFSCDVCGGPASDCDHGRACSASPAVRVERRADMLRELERARELLS